MSLNVLFVGQTSRLGGAEKVLLDFLENLDRTRIKPTLAVPKGGLFDIAIKREIECFEVQEFETFESTRKRIKISDLMNAFKLYKKMESVINSSNPDIIYTNTIKAHILCSIISKKKKIPMFVRLHDFPSSFSILSKSVLKMGINNADVISCVSNAVAEDLKSHLKNGKDNIEVCFNGLKISEQHTSKNHHFRKPRIVIAGWMLEWKGHDLFIDAMEKLANELVGWDFVIAGGVAKETQGSAEFFNYIQEKISKSVYSDRFILCGTYKSLSEVVCCSSHCIFVQPSKAPDPLPTVILEAASYSVPVIASHLGGSKEIIESNISGKLIYPSVDEIVTSVKELATNVDLRINYGTNLNKSIVSNFSMEKYVGNLTTSLEKLAKRFDL